MTYRGALARCVMQWKAFGKPFGEPFENSFGGKPFGKPFGKAFGRAFGKPFQTVSIYENQKIQKFTITRITKYEL